MTREEQLNWLYRLKSDISYMDVVSLERIKLYRQVLSEVIKALEQEPILDKIRAELIQSIQNGTLKIESGNEELFRILDKYKAETVVEDGNDD